MYIILTDRKVPYYKLDLTLKMTNEDFKKYNKKDCLVIVRKNNIYLPLILDKGRNLLLLSLKNEKS